MKSENLTTKTKKQLSQSYNIHSNTLRNWLKKIPDLKNYEKNRILSIKQLEIIYNFYGKPQ